MNVNTGELINRMMGEPMPKGFEIVPPEHQKEAEDILDGKEKAIANMEEETPLVKWAKSRQRKQSNNLKAMQRKSKKTNRRTKR